MGRLRIIKKQRILISAFSTILLLFMASCDDSKEYEKREAESIQYYLNNNKGLDFQLKTSGLYYCDVLFGSGPAPATHDTAYIRYKGMFLNETIFESNMEDDEPFAFPVGEGIFITGFEEGIMYMKTGGIAYFLIPSSLAYGSEGFKTYWIPGYTPLLYEVELVGVVPGP